MRVSWLEPPVIRAARAALTTDTDEWEHLFTPDFRAPAGPAEIDTRHWPAIAEHVARAERVSAVVRDEGVAHAVASFSSSPWAIEVATLIAATCADHGASSPELLRSLFACAIDELVVYGSFLSLLLHQEQRRSDTIDTYSEFCEMVTRHDPLSGEWQDRAASIREGLADLYIASDRPDHGDEIYTRRHREDQRDVAVALSASRSFLSAGHVAYAISWLGRGADRARDLGRTAMEKKLREKQTSLRTRTS